VLRAVSHSVRLAKVVMLSPVCEKNARVARFGQRA
jgi:hypothetical protein